MFSVSRSNQVVRFLTNFSDIEIYTLWYGVQNSEKITKLIPSLVKEYWNQETLNKHHLLLIINRAVNQATCCFEYSLTR